MSEYKTKIFLGAVVAVIMAVGLAAAAISFSPQLQLSSSTALQGAQSVLIVQLTDPPIVPEGTTSLNLTYSAINVLIAEPSASTSTTTVVTGTSTVTSTITSTSQNGEVTSKTVTIVPNGGSATVDLLKLQNISQTIGLTSLPSGSTIYSVSFVVSSIRMDINGSISTVTLATGGNTLLVTLVKPALVQGTNLVLLDLTPTIINTPTGYQMIPSSIGVIKPQSEISDQDHQIGSHDQLTHQDQQDIGNAQGQLTANLLALSVSGTTTTITVQVSNTGNSPVQLVAISLHGNFTAQGTSCVTTISQDNHGDSGDSGGSNHADYHSGCDNTNEVVFAPSVSAGLPATTTSSTTSATTTTSSSSSSTSASCTVGQMTIMNGNDGSNGDSNNNQVVIAPGQCITLTFSGTISFGESGTTLIPSSQGGQTYIVHVIASDSGEMKLGCTLPLSSTSCTATSDQHGHD